MDWDKTSVDLGVIEPKKTYHAIFTYLGHEEITKIVPSCGCSKPERKGRKVIVKLTAADNKKEYTKNVSMKVFFKNKTQHILRITSKVKSNVNI